MISARLVALSILILTPVAPAPARAADACDALTARMIRATGASLAGREGSRAVFRAADVERMTLDCRAPRRMVFVARARAPGRPFYDLIGLAAEGLTGAEAGAVETLALSLHQEALLTGQPRQGTAGRAALRCETAPDTDPFVEARTRCILVPNRPPAPRRRAGLSVQTGPG